MINAIAIDDEPLALTVIQSLCDKSEIVNLQKTFTQPNEAVKHLKKFPVDLIFCDIQMPYAKEEWYEGEVELKGKTVNLDLYAHDSTKIEESYIKAIDEFIDELPAFEESVRLALKNNLKERGFTYSYISILLEYTKYIIQRIFVES